MGRLVLWGFILLGAAALLWWALDLAPPDVAEFVPPEKDTDGEEKVVGPALKGMDGAAKALEDVKRGNASIYGVVVDTQGNPLSGIRVTAAPRERNLRNGGPLDRRNALRLWQPPARPGPVASFAATAADGAFEVKGLEEGRRHFVRADVQAPLVSSTQDWSATRGRSWTMRLVVEKGAALKVRVVDADGAGMQAWVQARKRSTESARPWLNAPWSLPALQTGADGRLALPAVPDGPLLFHVSVPGRGARNNLLVQTPTDKEVELRFEDASGGTLAGRVTATTGEPVAGAKISVDTRPTPVRSYAPVTTRGAVTDAEGNYTIERLPPGAIRALFVIAEGFIAPPALARGVPVRAEKVSRVDIVLARGATIVGRVTDGQGQPLANAGVQATRAHASGGSRMQPLAEATTDAGGTFTLTDVALGAGVLYARLEGYYQPKLEDAMSSPYPWMRVQPGVPYEAEAEGARLERQVVLKRGTPIEGTVLGPDGIPVEGVRVSARPVTGGYNYAFGGRGNMTALSDAEGGFGFAGLAPDQSYNLEARSETLLAKPQRISLPATGPAPPVEIQMLAGAVIAGHVLQEDGVPAAGASIYCNGQSGGCLADAAGAFRFEGVKEGTWTVQVSGMSNVPGSAQKTVTIKSGEAVEDVELTIPPMLSITGIVVDEDGEPLPGVSVTAALVKKGKNRRSFSRKGISDAEGRFEIRALLEGDYKVYGGYLSGGGTYQAGARDLRLEYRAPELEEIEGRVLDADGRPVARGQIRIWTGKPGKRNRQHNAVITGGRFYAQLNLVVDDGLDLEVQKAFDPAGRAIDFLKKRVKDLSSRGGSLEVRLERGLVVTGRVVDPTGKGLSGIQVRIARKGSNNYNWRGPTVTQTGEDGAWRFGGLQEGEFTLSVTPGGEWMNPEITPVDAGEQDVVIKLARGFSISGKVLDPDGAPLAAADTWVNETPASRKRRGTNKGPRDWTAQYRFRAKTGPDGTFDIKGLPEDAVYHVGASGSGPDGAYTSETIKDVAPGSQDLVIRLGEAALIEGVVLGPSGEAITQGSLRARPVDPRAGLNSANFNLRNNSNQFKIGPLKPGRYRLTFSPRNQTYGKPPPLEVDAPSTGVRLEIPEVAVVEGRLLGADVQGFTVTFLSKGSSSGVGVSRDGRFKIKGTQGKVGSLYAHKNGDSRYAWVDDVEIGLGQDYRLTLQEGFSITGRIEGLPYEFKKCNVYARGYSTWIHGRVERDGSFLLTGLPPGRFTVQAWRNGGTIAPVKDVEAGSDSVILEFVSKKP